MEILHISDLSFTYPETEDKVLSCISFCVNEGEFITLSGPSGCGKTTLLRLIKRELAPYGKITGSRLYWGKDIQQLSTSESLEIGFVMQRPDNQIAADTVWHELALGLENMGLLSEEIRRRTAEIASFFGIEGWFRKKTSELSGGQKQILNLASALVMQPRLLLLDEPTSQLDPIAASEFLSVLHRINNELGITVIMSEHKLEEAYPISDRCLVMNSGRIIAEGRPEDILGKLKSSDNAKEAISALPCAARIFDRLHGAGPCPVTVRQGRDFLRRIGITNPDMPATAAQERPAGEKAAEIKDIWFRYSKDGTDILRGLSLDIYSGEIFCLLGGNGSGKTTALNIAAGLVKPYHGNVKIFSRSIKDYKNGELYRNCVALLPQDVQEVFTSESVGEDLEKHCSQLGLSAAEAAKRVTNVRRQLGIDPLINRHPLDLSGGEQQKCAIAKLLLSQPRILMLDEPTKGIDAYAKENLVLVLKALQQQGKTVLLVTHDVEFACRVSDRCALLFDGSIASQGMPNDFFSGNFYYTTAASRISRGIINGAVTTEDIIEKCRCGDEE